MIHPPASPRILFAGGGGENDSRPLDEPFAGWVGPQGKLLYLPTALVELHFFEAGYRWIKSVFDPLGLNHIEMWTSLAGKTARDLASFDAVYIGGGNTFHLLHQLRVHRLDILLSSFIKAGHPAYGGSAGAIVLGRDITSSAHIDPDIVGLDDLRALDLALGHTIWCHYTPADEERVRAYVSRTGVPSVAVSERSGVYREGDRLYAAGYEPAYLFTLTGHRAIDPGSSV